MPDHGRAELPAADIPGDAAWWAFIAARFPTYGHTAALVWWREYIEANGLWDTCLDEGHEFWCRFGDGSCARRGPLTCNATDEDEAALDAEMEAHSG